MAKPKQKTFMVSEPHHLYRVDKWWAGLLRTGAKEILAVAWEPLGEMRWKLRIHWAPMETDVRLNVGHPDYVDYSLEDLNFLLHEALDAFDHVYTDYTLLESRVQEWGLGEKTLHGRTDTEIVHKEGLADVDRLIAIEYVWPEYKRLKSLCAFLAVQLREAEGEVKSRAQADYFSVKVDRGMLREAFTVQVGYDNDFIFEEVEFLPPDLLE